MRLFIISNRLPLRVVHDENDNYSFTRSEGGLTTGLDSLNTNLEKHWIGWPGITADSKDLSNQITTELNKLNMHPIFLSEDEFTNYYEGYSNSTIWPLCHYFYAFTDYRNHYWEMYKIVNQKFASVVLDIVNDDDIIWVQDYQLMLLPNLLRKTKPELSIGYFHHIPFPSYELFRILPERKELLNGLLGADLIAFHTPHYMRHFISTAERVLKLNYQMDQVVVENRLSKVEAIPMGINFDLYYNSTDSKSIQTEIQRIKDTHKDSQLIISIDRLDYSKGILHRLEGYRLFLEQHPEYKEKVSLFMTIVPSRPGVNSYADLKIKIDELISAINGEFSTLHWSPVKYIYQSLSFDELIALYNTADIALITPLRDGMNLVCKEYVAAKKNKKGVLILSEMAGAADELKEAIIINPNDIHDISSGIYQALHMPAEEQRKRLTKMQNRISSHSVEKWANQFLEDLEEIILKNKIIRNKQIKPDSVNVISRLNHQFNKAKKRLLVFDYDGTLSPFFEDPELAVPNQEVIDLLTKLSSCEKNTVVINSGRDAKTLEDWFGFLPIRLVAEHGASIKENAKWESDFKKTIFAEEIIKILEKFVTKTPGSFIEKKNTTLVWHYRTADSWLGKLREQQLVNTLINPCLKYNLQIMRGNKNIEIKSSQCNKGSDISYLLNKDAYDFTFAIGDDVTDEDMFKALPNSAVTIKIGTDSSHAKFNICDQHDVVDILEAITRKGL